MSRILFLLFLVLNITVLGQSLDQNSVPFITNYTAEEYSAGIQNWDITQANDGRMYVANNLGLLQFDGDNWKQFQVKYGTKLRSLLIKDEMIYAGSQNDFGYFESDMTGQLHYISLADSLPINLRGFDETWKIFEDSDILYFCTFNEIFEFSNSQIRAHGSDFPLEISFQIDHELYVQEWGKGLSQLTSAGLKLIPNGDFFKDIRVSAILPSSKSKWLITTFNHGIFSYNDGEITQKQFSGLPDQMLINTATILNNGHLAIGTQTQGLFVIDNSSPSTMHLNKLNGLMDNTINSIYEDDKGSIWLSLNNGLSRIDIGSPLSIIDQRNGIEGAGYAALQLDEVTYLGTNIGAYRIKGGKAEFIEGTEGQVYSIQEINGHLFIGHHEGLMIVNNGQAKLVTNEKGAWKLLKDPIKNKNAILGTYAGLRLFDLEKLEVKQVLKNFKESSRVMAFDDAYLWVTQGYKGAFKIKLNNKREHIIESGLYNSNKGFPSDFLINVFEIDGQLIFSAERGLYSYNEVEDRFQPNAYFNTLLGAGTAIVDMDEDPLGQIYFIASQGIGSLSPSLGNQYELNTSSFGMANSQWNDDLGNITAINNSQVLIGAREGFILYDRRKDNQKRPASHISFNQINIIGEEDSLVYAGNGTLSDDKLILPYSKNSLSFSFYTPDFQSGKNVQYQFQLENFDEHWSSWTETNYKEFTNLNEGEYAFHVKSKNIFGQESPVLTYTFEIKPPIYRTKAAYLIYSTSTLLLLFFGFKTLDKRHKEETKAIEEAKNRELTAKRAEIKEISKRSEQEIDELKSKKLEAELRLKSQDLTSSAMHLIQKNELLTKVKKTLKGLDKENLEKEANADLRRLVKEIDKDLASGEEWSQFEQNFDQVHGNFITRLKEAYPKLTPQEIKFSAYIRMNLNTKEIANLLNISVRGVEIGRYRVRKKLALERKDNLSDFLMRF